MTHELEIRSFVQAVAEGTPVLATGEQGLMVTQILDALYQSAETGREILLASLLISPSAARTMNSLPTPPPDPIPICATDRARASAG